MGIAHNNAGNRLENLPWPGKNLMFFFNISVDCIINRTLRKHNTNEVKDSVIFLQTNISWLYNSFIRVMRLLLEMMYKMLKNGYNTYLPTYCDSLK